MTTTNIKPLSLKEAGEAPSITEWERQPVGVKFMHQIIPVALKSCPFCKSRAVMHRTDVKDQIRIHCTECHAGCTQKHYHLSEGGLIKIMTDNWNNRQSDTMLATALHVMEETNRIASELSIELQFNRSVPEEKIINALEEMRTTHEEFIHD